MVATWTVEFKRDLIAQCADEQTVESEQIFFAGNSLKLSLVINSKFTAMGELQIVDSPQMNYLVLVFDSTRNIMHYWNHFSPKPESKKKNNRKMIIMIQVDRVRLMSPQLTCLIHVLLCLESRLKMAV